MRRAIYFQCPYSWDTAQLICDFIKSGAKRPGQNPGDLLLIGVAGYYGKYDKGGANTLAKSLGYEVLREDFTFMGLCFVAGYTHTSFAKGGELKVGHLDGTIKTSNSTWIYRRM